jgi:hypothetical protein
VGGYDTRLRQWSCGAQHTYLTTRPFPLVALVVCTQDTKYWSVITTMPGRYPLAGLAVFAFSALNVAAVPADPTITAAALLPRQNDAAYIGWIESSSGVC